MKQFLLWFFVLGLAALNWAALHDILKGEADVWLEWTAVVISLALLFVWAGRRIMQSKIG